MSRKVAREIAFKLVFATNFQDEENSIDETTETLIKELDKANEVNKEDLELNSNQYLNEDLIGLEVITQNKSLGTLKKIEKYSSKYETLVVENNEKCNQCELYKICTRGCLPINCLNTGKYLVPTNSFCSWNQIFYNHSLKIISHFNLYKNNELFKEYYLGSIIKGEKYNVC